MALTSEVRADCMVTDITLKGGFGEARFHVEPADTADERAQGLMFRRTLPRSSGMLFIYETPQNAQFWMKNTYLPLDLLFADNTGTITRIHSNAVPLDETPIPGGNDVRYVLEINGGLARDMGIKPGDRIMHPAINAQKIMPFCEN